MVPTAMWWKIVTITMAYMACTAVAQNASNIFTLDAPTAFGSGCEHGEVQVVPSVDQRSFSILFSDFESSTSNGTISRKACNVVVPVNATSGYSVGFFQIDYRGFVYVPSDGGAYARLSNEYFFAGQRGATLERKYGNGTDSEILETSTITIQSVIWSPCGGSANFRINTSITAAKKRGSPEDTIIQIDSIDGSVQGQVKVYLTTRKCEDA